MRVVCNDVDEFLECIEQDSILFQNTIRTSIIRTNAIRSSDRERIKFIVIFQVSAVVIVDDEGSQYLLEAGIDCGKDYLDDPPELEGTESAKKFKEKVKVFAKEHGLKVMPGIIHE